MGHARGFVLQGSEIETCPRADEHDIVGGHERDAGYCEGFK